MQVGDEVWFGNPPREGLITEAHPNRGFAGCYWVKTRGGGPQCWRAAVELTPRTCKTCGRNKAVHTEKGKCLYGPGNWEEA